MMKNRPLVSVILASYNHKDFVEKAVRSVLNQTFSNLELIIVDDGSTDGTPDIIEKIDDERIIFMRLDSNRLAHPRNYALQFTSGEYVAFQNSDDLWKENKLEEQLKVFQKNKSLGACFTKIEIIDENDNPNENSWAKDLFCSVNKKRFDWLRRFFDKGNCLCISSSLIKKDVINKLGGFRQSLFQLSDLDLWIRILGINEIFIVNSPLVGNRIVKGKNFSEPSQQSALRHMNELVSILERYAEKPLSKFLSQIFPDIIPDKIKSENIKLAYLSNYCWSKNSPSHIFFANKLISGLIDDPKSREEIVSFFGSKIIREFVKKTGQLRLSL